MILISYQLLKNNYNVKNNYTNDRNLLEKKMSTSSPLISNSSLTIVIDEVKLCLFLVKKTECIKGENV